MDVRELLNQYLDGLRDMRYISINPGMARRINTDLKIEVRITDPKGLERTYEALDWLIARRYKDEVDWDVDMHSGLRGYSSFYFHSQELATEFALVFK
jgi:hypothetical protein